MVMWPVNVGMFTHLYHGYVAGECGYVHSPVSGLWAGECGYVHSPVKWSCDQ